jgi:hypothetical protein
MHPVRLAYQPPANSTFLSEQTSHQQPASSTFLSEQTNTSHQPPVKRTGLVWDGFAPGASHGASLVQHTINHNVLITASPTHPTSGSLRIPRHPLGFPGRARRLRADIEPLAASSPTLRSSMLCSLLVLPLRRHGRVHHGSDT